MKRSDHRNLIIRYEIKDVSSLPKFDDQKSPQFRINFMVITRVFTEKPRPDLIGIQD
jgi:hypothetical protein